MLVNTLYSLMLVSYGILPYQSGSSQTLISIQKEKN